MHADKIRCNPMHPFYEALPVPYVQVRVTRGTLAAHGHTYAPLRCRTSQYRRTLISISVSLWNDFADPVLNGVGLAGFKSRANAFSISLATRSLFVFHCFPFLFFLCIGQQCGAGVLGLIGCKWLSPSFALSTFFNNNNNNDATGVAQWATAAVNHRVNHLQPLIVSTITVVVDNSHPRTMALEMVDPIECLLHPTLYRAVLPEGLLHSTNAAPQMRVQ